MRSYTATQAAKDLMVSQDFLRMKLRQGELQEIGKALKPGRGHTHWRYICYPVKVAQMTGRIVKWDSVFYFPDGRVEDA